jgi:hypothetical protein
LTSLAACEGTTKPLRLAQLTGSAHEGWDDAAAARPKDAANTPPKTFGSIMFGFQV